MRNVYESEPCAHPYSLAVEDIEALNRVSKMRPYTRGSCSRRVISTVDVTQHDGTPEQTVRCVRVKHVCRIAAGLGLVWRRKQPVK